MASALQAKVTQRIKELGLSLPAAAKMCGLEYPTLVSVRYGRTLRPGPEVLNGLTHLGFTYAELALAAYGVTTIEVGAPA